MDKIKFSIEVIENGWVDLLLLFNGDEVMLYFENVPNDPLYSLLESAIKIIGKVESTIILHNGSQRRYLSVKMLDNDFCRFGVESAYIDLSVKQFCKEIIRMFDTYAFTFSKEEYSNHWDTFPETEIERLRALYHAI